MSRWLLIAQHVRKRRYGSVTACFMRAFASKGIDVDLFDACVYPSRLNSFLHRLAPAMLDRDLRNPNQALRELIQAQSVEHVFVVKGTGILPETLEWIRERFPKTTLSCFNPDDPLNASVRGATNRRIRECIPFYHHYFIWSRGLIEPLERAGGQDVKFFPFAVDTELFHPAESAEQTEDIVFVGTGDAKRVDQISALRAATDNKYRISVYGYRWPSIPGVEIHPATLGEDMLNILWSSKIAVNLLRDQNRNSTNMRTFELPATGTFMMHEHSREATEFFPDGVAAAYFRSPEEFAEKADFYISEAAIRKQMTVDAYQRVMDGRHTYEGRVEQLLKAVSENHGD